MPFVLLEFQGEEICQGGAGAPLRPPLNEALIELWPRERGKEGADATFSEAKVRFFSRLQIFSYYEAIKI